MIRDGLYDTTAEDGQGVVPGPHKIYVTAYPYESIDVTGDETAEAEDGAIGEALFVNYEMTANVPGGKFDIVVPADAKEQLAAAAAEAANETSGNEP